MDDFERRRVELWDELRSAAVPPILSVGPQEQPRAGADALREEMDRIVAERRERLRLERRRLEIASLWQLWKRGLVA
jgi:hypothetical protein